MQVLSANPADIDGPLVLTPVKPGDPHQLWYQDFWNQFGCSRSTWNVIKETQHIRSEAFVLINQATKRMIWAGDQDQPLRLVDYDMGADADNTRQCTLFDMVSQSYMLQYQASVLSSVDTDLHHYCYQHVQNSRLFCMSWHAGLPCLPCGSDVRLVSDTSMRPTC